MFVLALSCAAAAAIGAAMPAEALAQQSPAPQTTAPQQQELAPAAEVTPDPWPKTAEAGGVQYTIYQPQLDLWDDGHISAHAAVSVLPAGAKDPLFGVIEISAKTRVHRLFRTVHFDDIKVQKALFPSVPQNAAQYQSEFQKLFSAGPAAMSLDRLEAMLAITGAEKKARAVPVKSTPPKFVFSQTPAILVSIDGEPAWQKVQGTSLERIVNTRALVMMDDSTGNLYIHILDGFVQAPALSGPWTASTAVPVGAEAIAQKLAKENAVDLMEGQPDDKEPSKKPSLQNGAPQVFIATTPAELIVTEGKPDWAPIDGTVLLYVKNTTGNIFKNLNDQATYVLVTGRWFRAPSFDGPWQHVAGKDLPPDFSMIPDDSPKENVKASVPLTPQAQEAVIASDIPQTATINRATVQFVPVVSGAPHLQLIPNTPLAYVLNSPNPIIMVTPTQWYAVQNGVWFTAPAVQGPWTVATSVPAAIYSIPPDSPLYYVTYVNIYDVTPQYVVVGYTPGYMGTVVTTGGVVVYGTGYTYSSYIAPGVWYPAPVTYGYAANPTWTPWTGWVIGFGFGMSAGYATWGCAPYWGPMPYAYGAYAFGYHGPAAAWGPGGWAATTGNVYQHWGSTTAVTRSSAGYNAWTGNTWSNKVGTSYNSTTGRISAGQKASVSNVYTGNYAYGQRGATYNPTTGVSAKGGTATYGNVNTGVQNTIKGGQVSGPGSRSTTVVQSGNNYYADHDGNVYKDTGSDWEKYNNGTWNSMPNDKQTQSLQSQQQARQAGDQRSAASSSGSKDWGSSFSSERFGGSERSGGGDFGGGGFGGFRGGRSGGGRR